MGKYSRIILAVPSYHTDDRIAEGCAVVSMPLNNIAVVIGAMKAATTSLHSYMTRHPEVHMAVPKELNFFSHDENWKMGERWYTDSLRVGSERKDKHQIKVFGDSSTSYSKYPQFPDVAERMSLVMPHARIIYIVRDPVARIISHYRHNVRKGREQRALAVALSPVARDNKYIAPSLYLMQLSRYLSYFPRSSILLLRTEELETDVYCTMRKVFRHIGVSDSFTHESFWTRHHVSDAFQPLQKANGGREHREALCAELLLRIKEIVDPEIEAVTKIMIAERNDKKP